MHTGLWSMTTTRIGPTWFDDFGPGGLRRIASSRTCRRLAWAVGMCAGADGIAGLRCELGGPLFSGVQTQPKRWFRCSLKALAHACGSDQFDRLGIGVGSPRFQVRGFAVKASGMTDLLE